VRVQFDAQQRGFAHDAALANTLLCVLPGYLLQLAVRGADAVKTIPDALRALIPTDSADHQ